MLYLSLCQCRYHHPSHPLPSHLQRHVRAWPTHGRALLPGAYGLFRSLRWHGTPLLGAHPHLEGNWQAACARNVDGMDTGGPYHKEPRSICTLMVGQNALHLQVYLRESLRTIPSRIS